MTSVDFLLLLLFAFATVGHICRWFTPLQFPPPFLFFKQKEQVEQFLFLLLLLGTVQLFLHWNGRKCLALQLLLLLLIWVKPKRIKSATIKEKGGGKGKKWACVWVVHADMASASALLTLSSFLLLSDQGALPWTVDGWQVQGAQLLSPSLLTSWPRSFRSSHFA